MTDRTIFTVPVKELKNLRKDDLLQIVMDTRNAPSHAQRNNENTDPKTVAHSIWDTMPSLEDLRAMIESLQQQLNHFLNPQWQTKLSDLTNQISTMQTQLDDINNKINSPPPIASNDGEDDSGDDEWITKEGRRKKTFAEAVRQSVASAFREERDKREVIISKASESTDDMKLVKDLCQAIDFQSIPTHAQRLGKKGDRPRLLKATFQNEFDARSFIARYEQARRDATDDLPSLRVRSSKNKEERAFFSKNSKLAYTLNEIHLEMVRYLARYKIYPRPTIPL